MPYIIVEMFEELNLDILDVDIERSIRQLKSNKSGGPDKIINELFIHGNQIFYSQQCTLWSRLFSWGMVWRFHNTTSQKV